MPTRSTATRLHSVFLHAIGCMLISTLLAIPLSIVQAAPVPQEQPKLPAGVKLERDIPYIANGDEAQRLDLYFPEQAPEKALPLIVHIHGGGWIGGSRYPCPFTRMVSKGYVVASIGYRFSQKAKFPAQIQDCQAAIRWLRANSAKYSIDPDRVGVAGGSAGGHLSALVGTAGGKNAFSPIGEHQDQSDCVQCVLDIFGPTNFATVIRQAEEDKNVKNIFKFNTPSDPYSSLIGMDLDADATKTSSVSPVHYVSKQSPPTLILHGTHDALVPYAQSEEFYSALKEQGVEVWFQRIPGAGHGGPVFNHPKIIDLMTNFFDKTLNGTGNEFRLIPEAEIAQTPAKP